MPPTEPRPCVILVANQPRSYREAIGATIQERRSHLSVVIVDPALIDAAFLRLAPDLVVCSQLTNIIERHASAWVVLYPDGVNEALIYHAERRATVPEVSLDGLLSVIDEVHSSVLVASRPL